MKKTTPDPVNRPAHYTHGKVETIDAIEAALTPEQFAGFCLGNAIKYLSRANHKDAFDQDLRKAQWYLNRIIGKHKTRRDHADPLIVRGADLVTAGLHAALVDDTCISND